MSYEFVIPFCGRVLLGVALELKRAGIKSETQV